MHSPFSFLFRPLPLLSTAVLLSAALVVLALSGRNQPLATSAADAASVQCMDSDAHEAELLLPAMEQTLGCAGHSETAAAQFEVPLAAALGTAASSASTNGLRYTMDWRAHRPLVWDDFRGHPKPETGVDAVSSCGIRCDPELRRDGTLRFSVNAYFSHHDSWVDNPDASNYLLVHEQRHFDLAELYARKLRKELQATDFERGKLNKQIQQTYDRVFRAYKKAQGTYDKESAHSTDVEAQQRWDRWIQDELYRHRHWAGSSVQGKVRR